jgi:hypothetical protein
MQLHPWVITSWPIIERSSEQAPRIATDLQHLGTVVSGDCDEYGRLLGHTIWGAADLKIGVAWDWTETLDGVFALSDPMGVVSNIDFIDEAGVSIPESMAAVRLNHITHALPWQDEVSKATRGLRAAAPWHTRMKPPVDMYFRASELGGLASLGR